MVKQLQSKFYFIAHTTQRQHYFKKEKKCLEILEKHEDNKLMISIYNNHFFTQDEIVKIGVKYFI